jgi:integrase
VPDVHPRGRQPDRPALADQAVHPHGQGGRLPSLSLHGLRHSYASNALRAGVPVKVVSGRIEHAQVSTTMDIYVTTHEAQDADAAERVAAVTLGADVINR